MRHEQLLGPDGHIRRHLRIPRRTHLRRIVLTRTCTACPAQWEGTYENGDILYVRYRHGHFSVNKGGSWDTMWDTPPLVSEDIGDAHDGYMDDAKMLSILNENGINATVETTGP
jgi:hypothetical protein